MAETRRTHPCVGGAASRSAQRPPHVVAEMSRTLACAAAEALSALGGGEKADTCVCSQQTLVALSAAHSTWWQRRGGHFRVPPAEAPLLKRAAHFAHGGGDEADTCVCLP